MPKKQGSNWFGGRISVLSEHFKRYERSRAYEMAAHLSRWHLQFLVLWVMIWLLAR